MSVLIKFVIFFVVFVKCECEMSRSGNLISGEDSEDDGKSSLVFVFDVTGSMYNDLRQVREGAEMILNTALTESDIIADFVFVPYHDPTFGPATVTRDKEEFKRALNIVRVYGGGDCPEMSLHGIELALNVSRPRSFLYVFTDATAYDHKLVGRVLDKVQRKQSQVVFILTGHCNDLDKPSFKVYQQIAAASSGQIFNLNKANVHKMLEFVKSSIKGRTVNLASVSNPAGYKYTQGIPVDSSLGEVTVSVSGAKPQITVVDPKGEHITGPPKLITTLDLSEIMVVKVMQPEPGNWTITVDSEEDYSVKVVGLSNLTFNHGFSVHRPGSIAETSYRPLKGTYNHLMITLASNDAGADIKYAEILSLDGKTLFELPLTAVDYGKTTYMAEPFIPPNEFFYIGINGYDQHRQELRRIGATAIQAKLPDVPFLSTRPKIEARAHSRVVLTCDVESLVPVTATWSKDSSRIQQHYSSLQSTSIDFVIDNMSEEFAGTYTCSANNIAGVSRASTEIVLLVEPPSVSVMPDSLDVEVGDTITVACSVYSEALLLENRLVYTGIVKNYAIEINKDPNIEGVYTFNKTITMSEDNAGVYTCVAANRGGKTTKSTRISVKAKPTAQILGPHTLPKHINTELQIVCVVEHADSIVWSAPNGSVVKELKVNGTLTDTIELNDEVYDGEWTCMAKRGDFNASDFVTVSLLVKPEVHIVGSKNITIVNGTVHEVICEVIAKPPPRILWHRETEKFLNNTITQLEENRYQSILALNSKVEDVHATYFCFGENSEGIHQDSVTVNVRRQMIIIDGFKGKSVELYSQVELNCQIDSYPTPVITWYHNGTVLTNSDNVHLSENNSTIHLTKVDFHDLGEYRCEAENEYEKMELRGTLSVHGLAPPILAKDPEILVTIEGTSTKITCRLLNGNPDPWITWQYKKNIAQEFASPPTDVVVNNVRNELVISDTTKLHAGVYRCIAENVVGRDVYDVSLIVQYPPRLSEALHEVNIPQKLQIGEKVMFSCEAEGSPTPVIVWTRNRMPIVYTDNLYLTNRSELVIEKASKYDSGVYTCNVTSTLGSTHRNFTLIVYDLPKITPSSELTIQVLEGQLAELPCQTQGEPTPTVEWTQNGEPLTQRRKYMDEYGLRFVANLTDFGEFTCTARNVYGNTSVTYMLLVWVPPHIVPPLELVRPAVIGGNASLQCDVIGFPLPTIHWKFNGEVIAENTTDLSVNTVGNLNISIVAVKHEGMYICVAENIAGVAEKAIYLKVYEPPKILKDNYTASYLGTDRDAVVRVSCQATGRPTPYILWEKDGFYLDKDSRYEIEVDGTLVIKSPSEDMSGVYMCTAKNTVGTDSKTVTVEIYPLPRQLQSEETLTTVTLVENTNGSIECPARTTQQSVKWYKNAQLISNGTLILPNVSRENASLYSCVVSNAVSSYYSKILLVVEWAPKFVGEDEIVVEGSRGDDKYLDCEVDAKPAAKTRWIFNSKPLVFEDKPRLKLINIQPRHSGMYKCIVSNVHGTVFREFKLHVLEPPFISDFDIMDVQLKQGDNATLECNAKGVPTPSVKWTFNNTNWVESGAVLSSANISSRSEGLFRCDATNKAGTTHIIYTVTVVSGARIEDIVAYENSEGSSADDRIEVVLGSHIRIACKASGNPIPEIQWIKQGRSISENAIDISYVDLIVHDVQTSHSGVYSCVASNEGGADERRIKLEVLEPPRIFQNLFDNLNTNANQIKLEVLSDQAFYLHCHPYGNPFPEIYWFKDDIPLKFFDDSMVSTDYSEVIVSKKALIEQSGNYTCVARNKVGNTSLNYLVDVLVPPPTPKESTKKVTATFNKELQLKCPVEGSPVPAVMWVKHPYNEISEETPRVILSEDRVSLTISKTEVTDSGKYSCIMTNKVGTTEVMFDVTILKTPSIAGNVGGNAVEVHVVPLKRSIVLKCEADGHPMPKITWLKDTQQLGDNVSNIQRVLGDSLLTIWSAAVRDAGQYMCVVQNEAGSTQRRYNVAVQVPAKWSAWSLWSYCNATCGLGYQLRTRACHYIDDNNNVIDTSSKSDKIILDESACTGPSLDNRKCHMPPCEIDQSIPRWSVWSQWSECSSSCGSGTQVRTRQCKSKAMCSGDNVEIRKCVNLPSCYSNPEPRNDDDDVLYSSEELLDNTDDNPYMPEATFEVQPEIDSQYPPDVEEFYDSTSDSEPAMVYHNVHVTENLDKSERGPCNPGYRHNTTTKACDDVDECIIEKNQCHSTQVCINTAGAYSCSCSPGYRSLGAGQRCLDLNECTLDTDRCEYACVNTAGGYVCACPKHLRLHIDKHHCVIPSLYRQPIGEMDAEYLSTTIDFPTKYTEDIRNT